MLRCSSCVGGGLDRENAPTTCFAAALIGAVQFNVVCIYVFFFFFLIFCLPLRNIKSFSLNVLLMCVEQFAIIYC